MLSGKIFLTCHGIKDPFHQIGLIRQLSLSFVSAGQISFRRLHDLVAESLQFLDIILNDGILQHVNIHGRAYKNRAACREYHGGKHIIRDPVRDLSDNICRSRCDEDQIRARTQRNVGHMHRIIRRLIKGIHIDLVLRQNLEGLFRDEFRCIFRHHYMNIRMLLHQHTGYICHLICGDPAGYAKEYLLSFQHSGSFPFWIRAYGSFAGTTYQTPDDRPLSF